jgi:hypothetical protein
MPVRKPRNHSRSFTGKFPSTKNNRMIRFESGLERDFIHLLEYEKRVLKYEEQPLEFNYLENGKTKIYTPDFGALISGRRWIFECKPVRFLNSKDNPKKFILGEDRCRERGWFYQVITDKMIRSGNKLRNVKYLWAYSRFEVSPELVGKIYSCILQNPSLRVIDVMNRLSNYSPTSVQAAVFHMAYHHLLEISVNDEPITNMSLVRMP